MKYKVMTVMFAGHYYGRGWYSFHDDGQPLRLYPKPRYDLSNASTPESVAREIRVERYLDMPRIPRHERSYRQRRAMFCALAYRLRIKSLNELGELFGITRQYVALLVKSGSVLAGWPP